MEVIQEEYKKVVSFSRISMWYMQDDEIHGCIAVDLHAEDRRFGGNKMLRVYDFNLLEENFSDFTKEAQKIKRVLQKAFPSVKVSSNFR